MKRRKNDPRVVEILAAFDRQVSSPARDDDMVCLFMSSVAGTAYERFTIPGGWSDDGIRSVLVAIAVSAPEEDFGEMIEAARAEQSWLSRFELEHEFETTVGGSCRSADFEAWKQERAAAEMH